MSAERAEPMAPGSVSLRLYPHLDLPAEKVVEQLLLQGARAEQAGFDGVMTSEHHNAFGGYLPNPVQATGWLLEVTSRSWAAACPVLLPLRPTSLLAEEICWLSARFPGRVAVGLASGSLDSDFTVMGLSKEVVTRRFPEQLARLSAILRGRDPGPLGGDPAVRLCATSPVPTVSAAMSTTAARRAAQLGIGLLFDSLSTVERCRELAHAYRAANGPGPVVLIRRSWIGDPPAIQQDQQLEVYRSYAPPEAMEHWDGKQQALGRDAREVAEILVSQAETVGADSLNIRVHSPGIAPEVVDRQIDALAEVRSLLVRNWTGSGPASCEDRASTR
jgi:alkanesulfonate monooxygenase SsuD/methylene tetrahydromethanopterin reductase-like flavin-dependent oxidoreductase (luciferase family)